MTKMNRREYLALMGASASVALGASCMQQRRANTGETTVPGVATQGSLTKSELPLIWKERWSQPFPDEYEPDQMVKLIFHGLGGFSPSNQGGKASCEVGFHSSGDRHHRHELLIYAYNNAGPGGACTVKYDSTKPKEQIAMIELKVEHPDDKVREAFFFQPGDAKKRNDISDARDFRWIIDFESEYLYGNFPGSAHPKKLPKVPFIYRPKFNVESGLFYTLRKTASTFVAKSSDGNYVSEIGNVADVIGANIYVERGTGVSLWVNTKEYRVQAPGEIYFINTCTAGEHCTPDPKNPNKELRSDFYLHYKAFERNGMPEYELFLADSPSDPKIPDVVCKRDAFINTDTDSDRRRLHDRAPCAGVGYVGSNGLT